MAAISETLGGKISNLGDIWDKFLLTLGTQTSGVAFEILDALNRGLEGAVDALTDDKIFTRLDTVKDLYVETASSQEDIIKNLETLDRLQKTESKNYEEATAALGNFKNQVSLTPEEFIKLGKAQKDAKEFMDAYGVATELLTKKLEGLNAKLETQALAIIPSITAEIKKYEALKNSAFDIESIAQYNNKLKELKDELELINLAGSESGFLKNLNAGVPQSPTDPSQTKDPLQGAFPTTLPTPDVSGLLAVDAVKADLAKKDEQYHKVEIARQQAREAAWAAGADSAAQYGDVIGSAFGDAAAGQITFAQAAKRATAEIVKTLLARAMAGIIASAATAGGPPPVAIALAAAGVAAIGALFAKFVGGSGGASGGGGANTPASRASSVTRNNPISRPEDRIEFDAKFEIEGTKLVAVTNNTNVRSQRTG